MTIPEDIKRLGELDRRFIWHPFTQMSEWEAGEPVIITEARDCFLKDSRGRWYLDGVSSLWVNIHGHRRREIDEALKAQIDRVSHSTLLGLGNRPSAELAGRVAGLMERSFPGACLEKVFYSDNGSTSVEVALKMAFQYWRHRGVEGRNSFLCFNNAYHGDTLGAVSVGGIDIFHEAFGPLLFRTHRAPSPYCYRCELGLERERCSMECLGEAEKILRERSGEIAAVIIEPLIQGAGGMIAAPRGFLKGLRELCERYGTLLIADEVATGFGRTGRMFACEHEGVSPDLMCLSKGITGGYMPLALTIATREIYDSFLGTFGELRTFFHGHSYTGNQLGCAAGLACLEIFEKDGTLKALEPKIETLSSWLKEISGLKHVGDARHAGFMAGVELVLDKGTKEPYPYGEKWGWKVADALMDRGVFIRPLGNVLVIMPPLAISGENLRTMLTHIERAIVEVTGN